MKRLFIAALLCLTAYQTTFATEPNDLISKIEQQGCIKIAVYGQNFQPFISWKNNKPHGYTIDLAKHLAKALGYKICLIHSAKRFNTIVDQVASGKADIGISLLSRTVLRAKKVNFTNPYLYVNTWLIVNRVKLARLTDKKAIRLFKTKPAIKIAVINKAYDRSLLNRHHLNAKNIGANSPKDKLQLVADGLADATITNEYTAKYWLKQFPTLMLYVRPIPLPATKDEYAIITPYHSPRLTNMINIFFSNAKRSGLLQSLKAKYLGG